MEQPRQLCLQPLLPPYAASGPECLFRPFKGPTMGDLEGTFPPAAPNGIAIAESLRAFEKWWDGEGVAVYANRVEALAAEEWLNKRIYRGPGYTEQNVRPWIIAPQAGPAWRPDASGVNYWWPECWDEARLLFGPRETTHLRVPGTGDPWLQASLLLFIDVAVSMLADVYLVDTYGATKANWPIVEAQLLKPMASRGFGKAGCDSNFHVLHANDDVRQPNVGGDGIPAYVRVRSLYKGSFEHDRFLVLVRRGTAALPRRDAALVACIFLGHGVETLAERPKRVSVYGRLGRRAKELLAPRIGSWMA